jgi:3-methyladenine DNA glycosylase AlkD
LQFLLSSSYNGFMTDLQKELFRYAEPDYARFVTGLNPITNPHSCLGVRIPRLRIIAKEFGKTPEAESFLQTFPHKYFEEYLIHAILIQNTKDFPLCLTRLKAFLPYVDNWAVCDTLRPPVFSRHQNELMKEIPEWLSSEKPFTIRFGVGMLMAYYLDDAFQKKYLALPASIQSEDYYVRMMIAWYYATTLAKQWKDTVPYLEKKKLPLWVHNKTIQKACESYRVSDEHKAYLKTLRW